jgi:hypothetical protein
VKADRYEELRNKAGDEALQAIAETQPASTGIWLANVRADDIAAEGTARASLFSLTRYGSNAPLPEGGGTVGKVAAAVEKWARADPGSVERFAAETPFPVLRRAVLLGCVAELASRDARAAAQFADRQTDTTLRYAMQEVIAKKRLTTKQP